MNEQFDFRALLLRIQDLLSENDRHRLHFLLGEDVPRYLRDDFSFSGTLRLLDSLFEKAFISDQDCDYLIEAFNKIHCHDAMRRLQGYQLARKQSNQRSFSLQDILLQDSEDDKICPPRIMRDIADPIMIEDSSTSLTDIALQYNPPISSPSVSNQTDKNIHRSSRMNTIFRIPLTLREYILLMIITILATLASLLAIKLWSKYSQPNTITVSGIPNISLNARWSQNGVTAAGGHGAGNATNQLNSPFGLSIDDDQTIVIADWGNNRIVEWKKGDKKGRVFSSGHNQINIYYQLHYPTDVLIDKATDSVIICSNGNGRVLRWPRRSGSTEREVLINGISCYGLAMDDQKLLYISDAVSNEIRRYNTGDQNGTVIAGGHGRGDGLNQFDDAFYIFVDQKQAVYVSDNENHRVMKWDKCATEGIVVAGGHGVGSALTQLNFPQGLFVDTLGTVYVADSRNNRVVRWPKGAQQGFVIVGGNGLGERATQLNAPWGLSFDRYGSLYVVDSSNNRVQRFSLE
ncbi:unnamed protein product [Rotaria socialis]|uniref:DED domain-containing protein n=2 Tax=Rotaria socialis TaxID=392032 RepID=A0A820X3P6_9BILA|nr:unnamed protein product [Rotaria socialis]CAF4527268.1 unnamed protein product [Rotaria socialis]